MNPDEPHESAFLATSVILNYVRLQITNIKEEEVVVDETTQFGTKSPSMRGLWKPHLLENFEMLSGRKFILRIFVVRAKFGF